VSRRADKPAVIRWPPMAGDDERPDDPDRAAILARRKRFIALAISGLATTGCKQPEVIPCLSPEVPEAGPDDVQGLGPGPIVEDPGAPLESGGGETDGGDELYDFSKDTIEGELTQPQVCLQVQPKPHPKPRPCLKKAAPRPCLMIAE
jgi:hypothetical protein